MPSCRHIGKACAVRQCQYVCMTKQVAHAVALKGCSGSLCSCTGRTMQLSSAHAMLIQWCWVPVVIHWQECAASRCSCNGDTIVLGACGDAMARVCRWPGLCSRCWGMRRDRPSRWWLCWMPARLPPSKSLAKSTSSSSLLWISIRSVLQSYRRM